MMNLNERHADITSALRRLAPKAEWSLVGEDIEWHSEDIPMPSSSDIDAEIERIRDEEQRNRYANDRLAEYPPIADFIDAYYWEKLGDSSLMEQYIEKVTAVKDKYPK